MKHGRLFGLVAILAVVALASVGCTDYKKKYLALLQLAEAESDKSRLSSALQTATSKLAAAEAKAAASPATGGGSTGTGAETTVYKTTVGGDILFSAGQATLTDPGKRALDSIADRLKSSYSGMTVRVYGYTDGDPIRRTKNLWQDNLDLSANRAMAVTRYLSAKGIDRDRIETIAMGETNPVASNSTKAGKAKNRRVEIMVVK